MQFRSTRASNKSFFSFFLRTLNLIILLIECSSAILDCVLCSCNVSRPCNNNPALVGGNLNPFMVIATQLTPAVPINEKCDWGGCFAKAWNISREVFHNEAPVANIPKTGNEILEKAVERHRTRTVKLLLLLNRTGRQKNFPEFTFHTRNGGRYATSLGGNRTYRGTQEGEHLFSLSAATVCWYTLPQPHFNSIIKAQL